MKNISNTSYTNFGKVDFSFMTGLVSTNGTIVGRKSSSVSELSKYSKTMRRLIKGSNDLDADAVSFFDLVSVFFSFSIWMHFCQMPFIWNDLLQLLHIGSLLFPLQPSSCLIKLSFLLNLLPRFSHWNSGLLDCL